MTKLTDNLWAFEIPKDAEGLSISKGFFYYSPPKDLLDSFIKLPEGNWQLIGTI